MSLGKEVQHISELTTPQPSLAAVGEMYVRAFDETTRQFHPWLTCNAQSLHAARRNPDLYRDGATINTLVDEARAAITHGHPTEDDIRLIKGITLYRLHPTVAEMEEIVGDFTTANELRNAIALDPYNRSIDAWRRSLQSVGDAATTLEEFGWRPDQPSMLNYYPGQKLPGIVTFS